MENRAGYKKTELGWIPESWEVNNVGNISILKTGATPNTTHKEYWENGTINWLTSGEVNNRYIYTAKNKITEIGKENSNTYLLPINTIIIALNGQGKTRGKVAILKIETTCNQSLGAFICKEILHYQFLFFYLESQYQNIRDLTGEGRNGLNLKILQKINIPLPPLPEQQKIASILTTVDDKISSIEAQIQQIEQLKKGLMAKLLTEGIGHTEFKDSIYGKIPLEWEVLELKKVCSHIIDCPHSTPKLTDNGFLVVKNFNVKDGRLILEPMFFTSEEEYIKRTQRLEPKAGDILISREAPVGEACLVPDGTKLCLGQRMMLIRPNNEKILNEFLLLMFYHSKIKKMMDYLSHGATAKHLNVGDISKILIIVPKLHEQIKIAKILVKINIKIEHKQKLKNQYEQLKKGLMAKLLTGQMRVRI